MCDRLNAFPAPVTPLGRQHDIVPFLFALTQTVTRGLYRQLFTDVPFYYKKSFNLQLLQ